MIKLKNLITEGQVKKLSPQEVVDKKFFGPIYHGTSETNHNLIDTNGFKIFVGHERQGNVSHGYEIGDYYGGIPAPIHHLGFGIYFTTILSIAKRYNNNTAKGLRIYYVDGPRKEVINFGSPKNMMKWWVENGYDYDKLKNPQLSEPYTQPKYDPYFHYETHPSYCQNKNERLRATINMTNILKSKYDLVWYKGKSIKRLLDGDQVCVYNPDTIYEMDPKLAKSGEIGGKVVAAIDIDPYGRGEIKIPMGTKGIITNKTDSGEFLKKYPDAKWAKEYPYSYDIQWKPGGKMYQVLDKWIKLL